MTINFQLRRIEEAAAPVIGQVFTATSPTDGTWQTPTTPAPVGASYVTLAADATLTNERVLTAGNGITITDGGANGNVTLASAPFLLFNSGVLVQALNTAAETDLINDTIPANTLGANGCLDVQMFGDMLNSSGAAKTPTFRVYFGGTKIYDDSAGGVASNAIVRAWFIRLRLANLNATNSQFINGEFALSDAGGATTGTGDISTTVAFGYGIFSGTAAGTIDTTSAQALRITVQWSAANANTTWRRRHYSTMVLK